MKRSAGFLILLLVGFTVVVQAQYNYNYAGDFTGSNYIAVRHSAELAPTSAITIEAWVYPRSFPLNAMIVAKNYTSSYHFLLRRATGGAVLRFGLDVGRIVQSKSTIRANVWTHVAVTYNAESGTTKFYVNGLLDTTTTGMSGTIPATTDSLTIGAARGSGSAEHFFDGYIDEVRIWNVARITNDINGCKYMPLAVFGQTSGPYAGLVAAYRLNHNPFDEGGSVLNDGVGRGMRYVDLRQKGLNHLDYNNTLVLDGGGYCIAPRAGATDATTGITVEAWVRRDTSVGQAVQMIVTKSGASSFDYALYVTSLSNGIAFNINTNQLVTIVTDVIGHERWTHVAATYSATSGRMTVYVNGDSVGGDTLIPAAPLTTTGDSILIGNDLDNVLFKGQIDEVRVWKNRVLTREEIRASMFKAVNWTTTPAPTDVSVWNFDGQNFDAAPDPGVTGPSAPMRFRGTAFMSSTRWQDDNEPVSPLLREDEARYYDESWTVSRRQLEIPDGPTGEIMDSVYVTATGALTGTKAFVLLNHPFVGELAVTLLTPGNRSAVLHSRDGWASNDIATVFREDADSATGYRLEQGLLPPFSPNVQPFSVGAFSALNGVSRTGWWKLRIRDYTAGNTGVLYGWGVQTSPLTDVGAPEAAPAEYALEQNYPNPFNPTTVIRYQLPEVSDVKLVVYDMLGREVAVLVNERRDAGVHEVKFDGSNLASGVYLYRLTVGSFVQTRKLILVR